MTINKRLVGAFLALVALFAGSGWYAFHTGDQTGYARGLTDYHNMCYAIGGIVIINGQVVACQPLGQIPKEELPLDKGRNV